MYIVGCYHQLQDILATNSNADAAAYSNSLDDVLKNVTFVGEEAGDMKDTLARRLADKKGLKYSNLDIPPEAKKLIRYVREEEYVINREHTAFELQDSFPAYRKAWGLVREFHMYKTFLNESASHSIALLICGLKHVEPLQDLFSETHEVHVITPTYTI